MSVCYIIENKSYYKARS